MAIAYDILLPVASFVCGAIPFGVIIARAKGVNPFAAGSGNIGATNIGRLIGKPFGILVFVLDFLKGFLPTSLAISLCGPSHWTTALTGLAAILGHVYSPFIGFRGGKGVATGAGAVVVVAPLAAGYAVIVFVSTLLASGTMSLASISAAVAFAISGLSLTKGIDNPVWVFSLVVGALVIFRHKANLHRLVTGAEPRIATLDRWHWLSHGAHTLSLGLWFGSVWFFSLVVAPAVFSAFQAMAYRPPDWLTITITPALPNRLAGVAVSPVFPPYFQVQSICGAVAVGTAIGFLVTLGGSLAKWRASVLLLAIVLVAIGWPVNLVVSQLRFAPSNDEAAKAAFASWHGISMALNLATLLLVAPAMIFAGYLTPRTNRTSKNPA